MEATVEESTIAVFFQVLGRMRPLFLRHLRRKADHGMAGRREHFLLGQNTVICGNSIL